MSKKSWHLDRRTFLKGVGVVCAVPYLEGMGAAKTGFGLSGAVETPRRMCFVYFPNGCSLPGTKDEANKHWRWFPSGSGKDFQFTRVLESLEPFRNKLSVLGGLSHPKSRQLLGHIAGDTWLTAGDVRGGQYQNSISVDQVAAHQMKRHTRYPSLVLSADGGVGYKSRVSTLSFDDTGRPVPSEHRHRQIFERYFSPSGGTTTAERRRSLHEKKKVVDLVLEDSKRLQRKLGKNDQEKLDQYLNSLHAVEEQVRRNEAWLDVPLKEFDSSHLQLEPNPAADPKAYVRTMYDLMVLGFQLDLTRVMSFMIGREDGMGVADNYPRLVLGINKGHHTISHDTHEGHWDEWGAYDQWVAQQFAYFLGRMNEVKDEFGPLLDTTQVLYGSCCSTTHNANNYPLVLAGGSQMGLQHGEYRRYESSVPMSNLFVSMLNAAGVETETFADSTGPLPGLVSTS